jgi:S1-C subfamily serine protease/peroxiredoxin
MMKIMRILQYVLFLLVACSGMAASPVINDSFLMGRLHRSLIDVAERADHVTGNDLTDQLEASQGMELNFEPLRANSGDKLDYDAQVQSVVLVGSVFKCDHCDQWHLGRVATGWVLSSDGLMVTNNHVFEKSDSEAFGILTFDGRFEEIVKVESANRSADVAVFRVRGRGFVPLPVATAVGVGDGVHVISHPDHRFYTYTSGHVSRLFSRHGHGGGSPSIWMSITADYARGSSGGPVLNDQGEVVGMVSSTDTIYYHGTKPRNGEGEKQDKGPSQMVVKNCVSLHSIRALLGIAAGEGSQKLAERVDQVPSVVVPGVPMMTAASQAQRAGQSAAVKSIPLVAVKPNVAAPPEGPGPESLIGKPLADFKLSVIDGTELTSANVSGKVLLIDFWASWCGPCLAASPVLQALHEEYSERGLMVIGANTSERDGEGNIANSPKTARSYARKHNYTYTFTYGSDAFKDVCLVRGLPTMLIVDRDGTVRDVIVGFSQDLKNKIAEKLNPLL